MSTRKIRILRILTRLNIGGPAVHAALLTTRLDSSRFETCVVTGEPDASEGDFSDLFGEKASALFHLPELRRPLNPWKDVVAFCKILRVCWREQPDIIHTHMAKAGALGRAAGLAYNALGPGRRRGKRAKLVHTFHGHVLDGYFSESMTRTFVKIERYLARRTDCLIAVSDEIRDAMAAKGIGRPGQWRVVPLGLDLSGLVRLEPPAAADTFRLAFVGRLVPIKNPGLFIRAVKQLSDQKDFSVEALIAGDGPLRQDLETEARHLGLGNRVRFLGWQRDLPALYREVDAACLTSLNEGTPVSVIEALAAARPAVATDVGGVRGVLGLPADVSVAAGGYAAGAGGLMVRSGDLDGLVRALADLARDAGLRGRLGAQGREHVAGRFSCIRLIGEMAALYESLSGGGDA